MLEDGVDLLRSCLPSGEYAVKYAIEPLLNGKGAGGLKYSGLKLIFALV